MAPFLSKTELRIACERVETVTLEKGEHLYSADPSSCAKPPLSGPLDNSVYLLEAGSLDVRVQGKVWMTKNSRQFVTSNLSLLNMSIESWVDDDEIGGQGTKAAVTAQIHNTHVGAAAAITTAAAAGAGAEEGEGGGEGEMRGPRGGNESAVDVVAATRCTLFRIPDFEQELLALPHKVKKGKRRRR